MYVCIDGWETSGVWRRGVLEDTVVKQVWGMDGMIVYLYVCMYLCMYV